LRARLDVVACRLHEGYGLRERTDADLPFLLELYADIRRDEMALVPWPEEHKRAFLKDQFRLQHEHYRQHYPGAGWWVITCGGAPVGRLYACQGSGDLRLMEIALLAPHRCRGLGSALVRE